MSWSTFELRVRLAPWNWFKPSNKYFYWPFQGGTSFVNHLCFLSCVSHAVTSVHCCLAVTCWERADLLALVDVYCIFVTFPCGILGQVWYLIVSFPIYQIIKIYAFYRAIYTKILGAQLLSGRVLDSRPRGCGLEPHWRHCLMVWAKQIYPNLVLVQPRKTRPYITEKLLMGHKKSNQTNITPKYYVEIFKRQSLVSRTFSHP